MQIFYPEMKGESFTHTGKSAPNQDNRLCFLWESLLKCRGLQWKCSLYEELRLMRFILDPKIFPRNNILLVLEGHQRVWEIFWTIWDAVRYPKSEKFSSMLLSHIIITSEIVSAQPKSVLSYVSETLWELLVLLPLSTPGQFLGQSPQFLSPPQEGI